MGQSIVVHGLIKKRGEIAGQHKVAMKAADALKADLDAIDRALVLCGYEDEAKAANLLKAELKRKGVTYAQLVEKLDAIGITEREVNVRNKLSRGKFSAAFMLQCLVVIGTDHLRL